MVVVQREKILQVQEEEVELLDQILVLVLAEQLVQILEQQTQVVVEVVLALELVELVVLV